MGAVSGLEGFIVLGSCTPIAVTDCELTYGSPNEEYFAVSGAGSSETVATANRGSGTINAVIDNAADGLISSVIASGELVTFTFTSKSGGDTATGQLRLGQPTMNFNREGTPQRISFPFMTHGALTGTLIT